MCFSVKLAIIATVPRKLLVERELQHLYLLLMSFLYVFVSSEDRMDL